MRPKNRQFGELPRSERVFAAAVAVLFLVPATWAALHHEMWRDEVQAWLLARDSPSLLALFHNLDYESHPPLWHLILYPLTRVTHDPAAMRPVHLAIAAGAVWLFAARAPVSRLSRVLFAAGYFPLYEYSAICRSYGLGMLFAFAFCAAWPTRRARPIRLGLALAGLAMTSFVGWIVACVALAPLLLDARARRAVLVALAGIACSFYFICPRPDGMDHVHHRSGPLLSDLSLITDAMLTLPRPAFFYWNENAIEHTEIGSAIAPVIGVMLVAWVAITTVRGRTGRAVYLLGTLALLGFFHFFARSDLRHHGYLFVVFLMGVWLARGPRTPLGRATIAGVLLVQAAGGAIALVQERRFVFSSGARAAAFLHANGLDGAPIVAEPDWAATTVLAYGDLPAAFSPRTHRAGSFVAWTHDRQRDPTDEELLAYAREVRDREGRDTVVLVNRPLPPEEARAAGLELRAELYDSVVPTENYVIYVLPAR